jgi:hypothetical protein
MNCYVLVPRYSYVPVAAANAVEFFQYVVIEFESDIWFESNNFPLRSHLPLGVLYDIHNQHTYGNYLKFKDPSKAPTRELSQHHDHMTSSDTNNGDSSRSSSGESASTLAVEDPAPSPTRQRQSFPSPCIHGEKVQEKASSRPWRVTVHFRNRPPSLLSEKIHPPTSASTATTNFASTSAWASVRLEGPSSGSLHSEEVATGCTQSTASEKTFFHSLKQALFLLYGHSRVFNGATVEQQQQLWSGVQTGNREKYEEVVSSLLFRPLQREVKRLPVRVVAVSAYPVDVVRTMAPVGVEKEPAGAGTRIGARAGGVGSGDGNGVSGSSSSSSSDSSSDSSSNNKGELGRAVQVMQRAVWMAMTVDEKDIRTTTTANDSIPSEGAEGGHIQEEGKASKEKSLRHILEVDFGYGSLSQQTVVVQGVEVPLDASAYDVWHLMAHGDMFLYIVLTTTHTP